jgi:hypothetical protein
VLDIRGDTYAVKGPVLVKVVDATIRGSIGAARIWAVIRTPLLQNRSLTVDEIAEATDAFEDFNIDPAGGLVVDLRDVA